MTKSGLRPLGRSDFRSFPTAERCHIRELFNHAAFPTASIAEARVEPGVTTALHVLDVDEVYIVMQGNGWMDDGTHGLEVSAGDSVLIPAGTAQRIENRGSGDLIFLCLCLPSFRADSYTDLEER